ncbi:ABC transporter permease [Priestia megaterium]|uniref:ABC transporter permease n=1 Tax=Priestia megaterium TaxID=1404 RepID=UPI00366A8AFE
MISRAISSDIIKYKRTRLWLIPILVPFIIILANAANIFLRYDTITKKVQQDGMTMWDPIWIFSFFLILLAIPLEVTLITSIISNIEHQANSWKTIFSMPVSRFTIYWNKFIWSTVLCITSGVILTVGIIGLGLLLGNSSFPWVYILGFSLLPFLAAVPLIALQLWVAMIFRNQAIPITLGSLGILLAIITGQLPLGKWLPWSFFVQVLPPPKVATHLRWDVVGMGLIVGTIILILGSLHFKRKELP